MTLVFKNVYIDRLDDIVDKYNNTYHSTIKIRPVVKLSTYISASKEINNKVSKFKINDIVWISKYKNVCKKLPNVPNWSKEGLFATKLKNTCVDIRGHILSAILKSEKLLECFTKKNYTKQIKKNLKLIK